MSVSWLRQTVLRRLPLTRLASQDSGRGERERLKGRSGSRWREHAAADQTSSDQSSTRQRRSVRHLNEEWSNVWPLPRSYDHQIMHLPLRMGRANIPGMMPPRAVNNAELIKIPNFFHLTPSHIEKHCKALKELIKPYPKEISEDRILRIQTRNYIFPGATVRHPGARKVRLKVFVKDLGLDERSRNKLIMLAGSRYNKNKDELTVVGDRSRSALCCSCPTKRQNKDHVMYLLSVLCHEASKMEKWENSEQELTNVSVQS